MYLVFKLLHITAVIVFVGNIATGLTGTSMPRVRAIHDCWRTHSMGSSAAIVCSPLPAVLIIILTGLALAILGHFPLLTTSWILWSLVLFSISGILFAVRVAPLQRRLRVLAEEAAASGVFAAELFGALALQWRWWGAAALAAPLGALALMVLKPAL